jgi:hypothetical protein
MTLQACPFQIFRPMFLDLLRKYYNVPKLDPAHALDAARCMLALP